MTMFATTDDLAARLGLTLTDPEVARATLLLEDAADLIKDFTKQDIELVEDDTLTVRSTYESRFTLPQRPVQSVASVTIDDTLLDDTQWYLEGDDLMRSGLPFFPFFDVAYRQVGNGWYGPRHTITVVYSHGWATPPALVKNISLAMVIRCWVNPGAVVEERVGNLSTTFTNRVGGNPSGMLLTTDEEERLTDTIRLGQGSMTLR